MYAERLLSRATSTRSIIRRHPGSTSRSSDVIINLAEHANPSRNSIAIGYEGEASHSTALINKLLARQTPHLTVHQEESCHC